MYYHTEITIGFDGIKFLYGLTILCFCLLGLLTKQLTKFKGKQTGAPRLFTPKLTRTGCLCKQELNTRFVFDFNRLHTETMPFISIHTTVHFMSAPCALPTERLLAGPRSNHVFEATFMYSLSQSGNGPLVIALSGQ